MTTADEHREAAPAVVRFSVITVSDSRTVEDDVSGKRIGELALAEGHEVLDREIVADDRLEIRTRLQAVLADEKVDVVVLNGGTGYSPRDVTTEVVEPLLDTTLHGFGELFRMLSWKQVGAAAMLSRAVAGLIGTRAVFVLPGSPKAVELAMQQLILPEAAHLLSQARKSE
jgi:molybdenum cofactor biosynthesis protein B